MYVCLYVCTFTNAPARVYGQAQMGMMGNNLVKTHMFLVDSSILINGTSPFPNLGCLVYIFHFYSISNRNLCKQAVQVLIRCHIL